MENSEVSGDTENNSSVVSLVPWMEKCVISGNTRRNVAVDDEVIIKCEILSRLPVKSLMRFKCVSKTWLSLIEDDPYFADLHFERSKARPALLLVIPLPSYDPDNLFRISNELVLTANLSRDRSRAEICSILKTESFCCAEIRGPANGLVCCVDRLRSHARIYNISTREVMCVESTFMPKVCLSFGMTGWYGYEIGFDSVSKKHKVLCACRKNEQPGQKHLGDKQIVCEVLTVGDNEWRRIDEVPLCDFNLFLSVYVNGFIYYCTSKFASGHWDNGDAVLVAFDVSNEKFRVITIPNLILNNQSSTRYYRRVNLLEVDGHAAIACEETDCVVKLWVYEEYNEYDSKWKKTKTRISCNLEENWTEDTITLPSPWDYDLSWDFYTGAGMHQLLIRSVQWLDRGINYATFYSYDLKKKTFTEIEVSGMPSSIPNGRRIQLASTYVESLFPIQKRIISSETPHSNIQQGVE
ncbi:putative F-box protein At1g32420 [Papaver somniferum]|uniref:putative F-box protein At1g32420 n=1 Tax=Papaver somniferum TaxID=3469 RepID=UPI000E6F8F70|nr:putative F-box protein At1g32420 [Papaver somniferum]